MKMAKDEKEKEVKKENWVTYDKIVGEVQAVKVINGIKMYLIK